ncbi:MAG: hypothetical protein O2794_02950 [bacterium]|nr:hypothetical protein [bacterium]
MLAEEEIKRQALILLQKETVKAYGKRRVCGSHHGREIALVAISPTTQEFEVVKIGICFRYPERLDVLTLGYSVEWTEGRGITRFSFKIVNDATGERLILIAGKHWMHESQSEEIYFPYSDDILTDKIVERGANFFLRAIREAQLELCALQVKSQAYPEKRLCQVFPDELIFNIALIEQIDDEEFFGVCPDAQDVHPENQIFNSCAEYSIYKALVHYAQNRERAFSFVSSRAGARGAMQFMRRSYHMTRFLYPDANLDADYARGMRDLNNGIKAAVCLLDYYLSLMPQGAIALFSKDPRTAGIYPIVAYNGGPSKAKCLYRRNCSIRNKESLGYQAKYKAAWDIIDMFVIQRLQIAMLSY